MATLLLTPLIALAAAGTVTLIIPPSPPPGSSQPQGSFLAFSESVGVVPSASGPDVLDCGFTGSAAPDAARSEQAVIEPGNGISMSALGTQTVGGVTTYGVLAFTIPAGFSGPSRFAVEVFPLVPGDLAFHCQQVSGPDTLATTGSADTLTVMATTSSSSSITTSTASPTTSSAGTTSASTRTSATSTSATSSTATSTTTSSSSSSSSAVSSNSSSSSASSSSSSSSSTSSITAAAASTSAFATLPATFISTVSTTTVASFTVTVPARSPAPALAQLPSGVPAQVPPGAPPIALLPPAPSTGGPYIIPRALPNTGAGGLALP